MYYSGRRKCIIVERLELNIALTLTMNMPEGNSGKVVRPKVGNGRKNQKPLNLPLNK